jgi:hypothetical protein
MLPDHALAQWIPTDQHEALALIGALQAKAQQHGLPLHGPPPAPDNCCGTGCIGCVWEGYGQEVAWWRDDVLNAWGDAWRGIG